MNIIKRFIHWVNSCRADAKAHPNTGYYQVPDGRHGHEGETHWIHRHSG